MEGEREAVRPLGPPGAHEVGLRKGFTVRRGHLAFDEFLKLKAKEGGENSSSLSNVLGIVLILSPLFILLLSLRL